MKGNEIDLGGRVHLGDPGERRTCNAGADSGGHSERTTGSGGSAVDQDGTYPDEAQGGDEGKEGESGNGEAFYKLLRWMTGTSL